MSSSQRTHTPPLSLQGGRSPGWKPLEWMVCYSPHYVQSYVFLATYAPYPLESPQDPPTQPHSFNFPWGPRAPEVVRSQEALFSHWKLFAPNMCSTQIFPPSVPRLPSFSQTFCKMVPTLLSDQRPLLLAHFTDRETKATTVESTARTIPEQESFAPGF